ncbi:MAG: glutathionylspermidine synthase family protein [Rhodospirillales bacterium]
MRRIEVPPRPDWRRRVEAAGFDFHTMDGRLYWDEAAAWEFTAAEMDTLELAAEQVHGLVLAACDRAVADGRLGDLGIPEAVRPLVVESWRRFRAGEGEGHLYGRFDISWAGAEDGPPKLLEYNADTPTALLEAAVVQWTWLEDTRPDADQFNSLHERLVARWRERDRIGDDVPLHLAATVPHAEVEGTVAYLAATAMEAGFRTKILPVDRLGLDPASGAFVDEEGEPVRRLYKLYPWEWLLSEDFAEPLARAVLDRRLDVVEPVWKLMATSKAMLALLWELNPGHPLLVPAHLDRSAFGAGAEVIAKPLFGREGANVSLAVLGPDHEPAGPPLIQTDGPYGAEGFVYQSWHPVVAATDTAGVRHHAVLGVWMVGDVACGLGLREDETTVTRNTSRFVPHFFR